jgi:hypothetical protein
VEGISQTKDVPYIQYVVLFLKNDQVQQPVIFSNNSENQNPWHMHILNIHTNIQQNKRIFTLKLWEELAGQVTYPLCNIYYQIKGQSQNGMNYYHGLEILTNKLQNKLQLDLWKENEITSRKPCTDGRTDR